MKGGKKTGETYMWKLLSPLARKTTRDFSSKSKYSKSKQQFHTIPLSPL